MKNINKYIVLSVFTWLSVGYVVPSIAGEKVDKSLPVDEITSVSIENLSGEVVVTGWDKPIITIKGELDDEAEKLVFEQVGNKVDIKVVMANKSQWNSSGSDLAINIPSGLRVSFESISSDIELKNLTHSTTVKTVSGDIKAKGISKHLELSTISGNIKTDTVKGKISLTTVSGDINDNNSTGRIQLKAVNGEIRSTSHANEVSVKNVSGNTLLDLDKVNEFTLSSVSGDNSINLLLQNNGMVKASTVSGSILMKFKQPIAADFQLKASAGGELINKLTEDEATKAKYGPSSKLYFQTGNANGSVRISTVSGDVIIK